ncbi:cell wall protein DAN4-like [Sipha flava]|uniref:Cell wall protein DAN4-like n=1 Tax=Sipha flava TaxID=143950 RepID=A0A8B8GI84_9HEMI|nr:cell wall protein DAN4-like [Sipha flava]
MIVSVQVMLTAFTWALVDAGTMNLSPCSPSVHGDIAIRNSVGGCEYRKRSVVRCQHSKAGWTQNSEVPITRPLGWSRLRWTTSTSALSSDFSRATPPYTVKASSAATTTTKPRRHRASVIVARSVMATRPNDDLARVVVNLPGFNMQMQLRSQPTLPPSTTRICPCTTCTIRVETRRPWSSTTETHTQPPTITPSTCTTTTCAQSTSTTSTCAPSTSTTTICSSTTCTTTTSDPPTCATTCTRIRTTASPTPPNTLPNGRSNLSGTWLLPIQNTRMSPTRSSTQPSLSN